MLLFFHNLPWSHPIALGNATAPLIDYISIRSQEARGEAEQHAREEAPRAASLPALSHTCTVEPSVNSTMSAGPSSSAACTENRSSESDSVAHGSI